MTQLAAEGDPARPRHVAIIMDGNGRWAKKRNLPRVAGHRQGVEAVRAIVEAAGKAGVEVLTLYAFSSENWRRPADEIGDLMGLMRLFVARELDTLHNAGVRILTIGDLGRFPPDIRADIAKATTRTAGNTALTVAIALGYGSRAEIVRVAQRLAAQCASGALTPDAITEELFDGALDTGGLPPLDLLIRTSGEVRLSNFLLWQSAYAEMIFTDTLWPDFDAAAFHACLAEFGRRHRRFGGL